MLLPHPTLLGDTVDENAASREAFHHALPIRAATK